MTTQRRKYSPQQKIEILREHLKNKRPVSKLCEQYGIHPNMFSHWEKQLFEGAIDLFSGNSRNRSNGKESTQEKKLKETIAKKDEVISWLTEENMNISHLRCGLYRSLT